VSLLRIALAPALGLALLACRQRTPEPPPPPPSASARELFIETAPPGAEAIAAGRRCATPCTLRLEPGRYRVALRKAGYLPSEEEVEVGPGGGTRLTASLVASH
jgi:hypothetical protein